MTRDRGARRRAAGAGKQGEIKNFTCSGKSILKGCNSQFPRYILFRNRKEKYLEGARTLSCARATTQ